MFDFHKLKVYQKAKLINRRLLPLADNTLINLSLRDQLVRASSSILLNITEGTGRFGYKSKRYFYTVANGSAFECVALLDILKDLGFISDEECEDLYKEFEELVNMTYGLIKSLSR